ncbi:hypothetical protein O6H91_Y497300 [Diphasiastrum complanatum]|nr:hypothetical protein O6H91_Y497300 [Diphasiastrum complanatum]
MGGERVRAVFFDLDDTLVLTHSATSAAYHALQAFLSTRLHSPAAADAVDGDALVRHFDRSLETQPWDPSNQIDVTEWRAGLWSKALQAQGIQDIELARELQTCFDKERLLAFQWAAGVEVIVKNLLAQGVKVGLITNGHMKVQRAKLRACKADELFEIILVGGEEANEKPHKDIFVKACDLAGCKPEEAIMIGDNLKTDIQGGLNAGFQGTIWVNIHNLEKVPIESGQPHYIISKIGDLPEVLKSFGLENC